MKFNPFGLYTLAWLCTAGVLIYLGIIGTLDLVHQLVIQIVISILLIPVWKLIDVLLKPGRSKVRIARDGSHYGLMKSEYRAITTLVLGPLAVASSPPVFWGSPDQPWTWPWICAFLISWYCLAVVWLARIRWNDTDLIATSPYVLAAHRFAWDALSHTEQNEILDYTRLVFSDGRAAYVGPYMEGYEELMDHAQRLLTDA